MENSSSDADISNEKVVENVRIEWNNRYFYIFLPYSKLETKFIKSLDGSYWNSKYKNWVVSANERNLVLLQDKYNAWDAEQYIKMMEVIKEIHDPYKIQLFKTPQYPDKINIIISGFRADIEFIKKVPGREYIKERKKWLIPLEKVLLERIIEHYRTDGANIEDRTGIFEQKKKIPNSNPVKYVEYLINRYPHEYHLILKKYTDTLIRQRYSKNTINNYTNGFGRFLTYLGNKQIENTSSYDVNNYLASVSKSNLSDSYINNEVNAIKFYYEKVEFIPDFQIDRIKRPRKNHKLPMILSIQDIEKMLRSTENLKHLSILYSLYGGGMRLGEVINLKIDDIYWDRDQVHIKGAKGKKDRYIMLSKTLKDLLVLYFDQYRPKYWLFEGQSKEQPYSQKSIQNIVKQAAISAGFTKKVTPHTLRHCFATHLMDGGVGIRYIQELLGHKDIHPVGLKKN